LPSEEVATSARSSINVVLMLEVLWFIRRRVMRYSFRWLMRYRSHFEMSGFSDAAMTDRGRTIDGTSE